MLLYTTLFLCGAVVMSLEILASRVLAVEFGEDLYVWGSLIGAFIGALSAGYYIGGAAADRWPGRMGLAILTLVSGAFIAAIVPFTGRVTGYVNALGFGGNTSLWAKPLLATLILYGIPTTLLGAVSPYCVRVAANDLSRLGRKVGGFYAVSSLGSIFGTFLTAFYLVGEFRVSQTIRAEGFLLVFASVPLFFAALAPQPPVGGNPKNGGPISSGV